MARGKLIATGRATAKLTPVESLREAIIIQAVQDIKQTRWSDEAKSREFTCSVREGYEAYKYLIMVLRYHGYSSGYIAKLLRGMTTQDYKKATCERVIKEMEDE